MINVECFSLELPDSLKAEINVETNIELNVNVEQPLEVFYKKSCSKKNLQYLQKNNSGGAPILIKFKLFQKDTPTQVLSSEYCKIFKNF